MKLLKCLCTFFLIFGLVGCGKEKHNNENNDQNIDTNTQITEHELLDELLGTWQSVNIDPDWVPYQTITFNDDFTCLLDETEMTYEIDGDRSDNGRLTVEILDNGESYGGFEIWESSGKMVSSAEKPYWQAFQSNYVKVDE